MNSTVASISGERYRSGPGASTNSRSRVRTAAVAGAGAVAVPLRWISAAEMQAILGAVAAGRYAARDRDRHAADR